jgi:hypothetical protein
VSGKGTNYSFQELPEEKKQELLARARKKVSYTQAREDKDRARKRRLKEGILKSRLSFEEIWQAIGHEGGINIGDGWCRIFTLTKYGLLQVNCTTRLEEKWLTPLSKEARDVKEMTSWPRGNLPKGNPWKMPHFTRAAVCLPTWHKELGQFEISLDGPIYKAPNLSPLAKARKARKRAEGKFPGGRAPSTCTFFFYPELIEDHVVEGYWTPKRQMQGRPWQRGDPSITTPTKRIPSFFQPDEYDLGVLAKALSGEVDVLSAKTHLIRRHVRERPTVVSLDVRHTIEFWLKAMDLPAYDK